MVENLHKAVSRFVRQWLDLPISTTFSSLNLKISPMNYLYTVSDQRYRSSIYSLDDIPKFSLDFRTVLTSQKYSTFNFSSIYPRFALSISIIPKYIYPSSSRLFIALLSGNEIPPHFTTFPVFMIKIGHLLIPNCILISLVNTLTVLVIISICFSFLPYNFSSSMYPNFLSHI